MAVEVELRSWIDPQRVTSLHTKLRELGAEHQSQESQETWYFEGAHDVRIQKSDTQAKMWMKSGAMHDSARRETEVIFGRDDFEAMAEMIHALGVEIKVKWIRKRDTYRYGDITVCVDHTLDYGDVIEAEILIDDDRDASASLIQLHELFERLGLMVQPRDFWDHKYSEYMQKWKRHPDKQA